MNNGASDEEEYTSLIDYLEHPLRSVPFGTIKKSVNNAEELNAQAFNDQMGIGHLEGSESYNVIVLHHRVMVVSEMQTDPDRRSLGRAVLQFLEEKYPIRRVLSEYLVGVGNLQQSLLWQTYFGQMGHQNFATVVEANFKLLAIERGLDQLQREESMEFWMTVITGFAGLLGGLGLIRDTQCQCDAHGEPFEASCFIWPNSVERWIAWAGLLAIACLLYVYYSSFRRASTEHRRGYVSPILEQVNELEASVSELDKSALELSLAERDECKKLYVYMNDMCASEETRDPLAQVRLEKLRYMLAFAWAFDAQAPDRVSPVQQCQLFLRAQIGHHAGAADAGTALNRLGDVVGAVLDGVDIERLLAGFAARVQGDPEAVKSLSTQDQRELLLHRSSIEAMARRFKDVQKTRHTNMVSEFQLLVIGVLLGVRAGLSSDWWVSLTQGSVAGLSMLAALTCFLYRNNSLNLQREADGFQGAATVVSYCRAYARLNQVEPELPSSIEEGRGKPYYSEAIRLVDDDLEAEGGDILKPFC